MRLTKQKDNLKVRNFDVAVDGGGNNGLFKRHGNLLPNTIRAIFAGPSNCGKTNVMLSLLIDINGLKFNNVYLYSKSLYQPKYQFLEKVLRNVSDMKYFPYKENDAVLDPNEVRENSIFIFDDVACDKQNKIREYFCMGRHKAVDCFYLCQTYTKIPKHLIRDNCNLIVLFKQDDMNLRHAYEDHVGTDMSFEDFKSICGECWLEKFGFLVIDKDSDVEAGRYRKGFDIYITPH